MGNSKQRADFDVEKHWQLAIFLGAQLLREKNEGKYTVAEELAISDVLGTITNDEIQYMKEQYAKDRRHLNLVISGEPKQIGEILSKIVDLERYNRFKYKNVLNGLGHECSVVDLVWEKEYKCDKESYLETVASIIKQNYMTEYPYLRRKEKEGFIKLNFLLIGNNYPINWENLDELL